MLAGPSCERGCLMHWFEERRQGATSDPMAVVLSGTDCSDGLLRCTDGIVEASRAAHLSARCGGRGEGAACLCPWDVVFRCPRGCAEDALEWTATDLDAGVSKLCRPDAPRARPLLIGDSWTAEMCAERSVRCVGNIVRFCRAPGAPSEPLAMCLFGCDARMSFVNEDALEEGEGRPSAARSEAIASVLCKDDQAERK
jgi:hypothetical protein